MEEEQQHKQQQDQEGGDSETQTEVSTTAQGVPEADVDAVLQSLYLTPFSRRVLTQRFQQLAGNPETFPLVQRVNAWFACESCDVRGAKAVQFTRSKLWSQSSKSQETMPPLSFQQACCPELIPGLRARAVWHRPEDRIEDLPSSLQWISKLQDACHDIRQELVELKGQRQFQQYRTPKWKQEDADNTTDEQEQRPSYAVGHDSGDWSVSYLELHDINNSEMKQKCPKTFNLLENADRFYGHAFFSGKWCGSIIIFTFQIGIKNMVALINAALTPHTHISPHHGPTNKKLRVHLGLVIPEPENCYLRVAEEDHISLREGDICVFDDSFEHEAQNSGDSSRIVLIADVWHPDLSAYEVSLNELLCSCGKEKRTSKLVCLFQIKILQNIQKGQLRAARSLSTSHGFHEVIENSRADPTHDDAIFRGV